MNQLDQLMARNVGEGLDALVHLDLRGYGTGPLLRRAGQQLAGGPMYLRGAQALKDHTKPGDVVVIATGFVFPPHNKGELDGLVGSTVVARALDLALGVKPVIVTEHELVPILLKVCTAVGLNAYRSFEEAVDLPHAVTVLPFTKDEAQATGEAKALQKHLNPAAILSIERPGRNKAGYYHMGNGTDVSHLAAKVDHLFELISNSGALTMAIGDLGNELGMASLAETIDRYIPYATKCQCPCGQGLRAALGADVVMTASVSDWGAYALAAALAYLTEVPQALHSPETEIVIMQTAVDAGAIDGSGQAIPAVDGIHAEYCARLVAMLRDQITLPLQTKDRYAGMFSEMIANGILNLK